MADSADTRASGEAIRIAVTWRTKKVAFGVKFGVLAIGRDADGPIIALEDREGQPQFSLRPAELIVQPIGKTTVGVRTPDGITYRIAGFTAQMARGKVGGAMIERTGALADPRQIGVLRQLKGVRAAAASNNPMTTGTDRLLQEIAWRPVLLGLLQGASEAGGGRER